jgi:hypothetical protein
MPARQLHAQSILTQEHRTPRQPHRNVELTAALDERTCKGCCDEALALDVPFAFGAPQLSAQRRQLSSRVAPAWQR